MRQMGCQSFGADDRVPYCRYEWGKIYDGMDMAFMVGYDSDPRGADTGGDFIEQHGLLHEAMDSDKVRFAERVKTIERRLGDPDIVLDSFILSPTPYAELLWRPKPPEADLEERHVLFMENTGPIYLTKLLRGMGMGGEV